MSFFTIVNQVTGLAVGPNTQQTAQDWCNNNEKPWTGTLPDLQGKIATDVNACSGYVKSVAYSSSQLQATQACQSCINAYYQSTINTLSTQQQQVNSTVQQGIVAGPLSGLKIPQLPTNPYALMGLALIIIVILIIIL